jgi:lysophospholipase L1-like esterase
MRRTLILLALLACAAVAGLYPFAQAATPPAYAPVGPGDVYLALGDSLSTGDEEPTNSAAEGFLPGYPDYFAGLLQQTAPISYTLLGVSGETSTSMRAPGGQLDRAIAYIADQRAAGRRVSPVTLSIGGNDAVSVLLGGTLTVTDSVILFRTNLTVILDELQTALGGEGDLLLMNYYNPYPDLTIAPFPGIITLPPGQEPIVTNRDLPKFNQVIAELAAERGIPVVDVFSAFQGRQAELTFVRFPIVLTLDQAQNRINLDYHPRAIGHQVIARGFAETSGYVVPRMWLPFNYGTP